MRRYRVLVWHVHGGYLYSLAHAPHEFYVPFKPERSGDYVGKWGHIPWPDNVHDVAAEDVRRLKLDCILFQLPKQYWNDQYEILAPEQRRLPKIYLEHDPPLDHPTDTRHWVNDPNMLLVHVTHYNRLMWNSGRTPTIVIEHGVPDPGARYRGDLERGLVVINHLKQRGRKLGLDLFEQLRANVPLDVVGMGSEELNPLGEVRHELLPEFESHYRFFFNPIRYTSLGLAVCEAMMVGMPVIGLATTEMAAAIENGISGWVTNDCDRLRALMMEMIRDRDMARHLGEGARRRALEKFDIRRFARDWSRAFDRVAGQAHATARAPAGKEALT